MSTALAYRRALWRFATSIVSTILNVVVGALMVHWVSEGEVSSFVLLMTVPLALTLANMWRCTVSNLAYIGAAISTANAETADRGSAQV